MRETRRGARHGSSESRSGAGRYSVDRERWESHSETFHHMTLMCLERERFVYHWVWDKAGAHKVLLDCIFSIHFTIDYTYEQQIFC